MFRVPGSGFGVRNLSLGSKKGVLPVQTALRVWRRKSAGWLGNPLAAMGRREERVEGRGGGKSRWRLVCRDQNK